MNIKYLFNSFYHYYPFLEFPKLLEYFLLFGGSQKYKELNIHVEEPIKILEEIATSNILQELPFFIFDKPFSSLLITLARGDGRVEPTFIKSKTPLSFKEDILEELIRNEIIFIEYSREEPLKEYDKQKIKKEFKHYNIQNKIRFTTPFYHFLFAFIIPYQRDDFTIDILKAKEAFRKNRNRVLSLWFEHLSKELVSVVFPNLKNCSSYWDRFSEFDLYCEVEKNRYLVGECKYTHKPITKQELLKLEAKIKKSELNSEYIAFFSKGGYSKELEKLKRENLLLFNLEDFKKLITS